MEQIKVTLKRSLIGCTQKQKSTARCLGLKRTGHQILIKSSPVVNGQINKIKHLLKLEYESSKKGKS